MQEQKKNKRLLLAVILLSVVVVALGTAVYLLARGGGEKKLDYAPQKVDEFAEQMDDSEEKLSAPDGGGAVSLTYSTNVLLDFAEKKAQILFQNPS